MLTRGSVLLAVWVARQRVSQTELGDRLGIAQSVLSNYLRGAYPPSRQRANMLEKASRGCVPAKAWDVLANTQELGRHAVAMSEIRTFSFEKGWEVRRRAGRRRKVA